MSPRRLFRTAAVAEAVTWVLLLTGMFLKYVTETTELGVRIGGMLHGVVFIAYCLIAVVVAVDVGWTRGRAWLALAAAVPPCATVWFDVRLDRRDPLPDRWRLVVDPPRSASDRPVALLLRHPVRGLAVGVLAVAALTGAALALGPPVG